MSMAANSSKEASKYIHNPPKEKKKKQHTVLFIFNFVMYTVRVNENDIK